MLPESADFGHLRHLQVVTRHRGWKQLALSAATVASLPPSLEVLDVCFPRYYSTEYPTIKWPLGWSAAHLTHQREFKASRTNIDDASIATLPPSLCVLDLEGCNKVTAAASFAHLTHLLTLSLRYAYPTAAQRWPPCRPPS